MEPNLHELRAPLPPCMLRLSAWFFLPVVAMLAGAMAMKLQWVQALMSRPWFGMVPAIVALCIVPELLAMVLVWRGYRRIRAAVVAASGRACVKCVHDLNGVGEEGRCPECGRAFDIAADQRSWARAWIYW